VVGKKFSAAQLDSISKKYGRTFTKAQKKHYQKIGGLPSLDGRYTVFGEVLHGMDVVDKISLMPRDEHDRPKADIRIRRVYVEK
jgi:cyclophilin family peptidyl-prolyl cis-trans isomerase